MVANNSHALSSCPASAHDRIRLVKVIASAPTPTAAKSSMIDNARAMLPDDTAPFTRRLSMTTSGVTPASTAADTALCAASISPASTSAPTSVLYVVSDGTWPASRIASTTPHARSTAGGLRASNARITRWYASGSAYRCCCAPISCSTTRNRWSWSWCGCATACNAAWNSCRLATAFAMAMYSVYTSHPRSCRPSSASARTSSATGAGFRAAALSPTTPRMAVNNASASTGRPALHMDTIGTVQMAGFRTMPTLPSAVQASRRNAPAAEKSPPAQHASTTRAYDAPLASTPRSSSATNSALA